MITALRCAVLPFAGAALAGGLVAGAGTIGVIIGFVLLAGVAALRWNRRRSPDKC